MCIEAVEVDPWQLDDIPNHLKTIEMCDAAVRKDSFSSVCVPDWFVTQGQVKLWHDDDDYCSDAELFEWYDGYKKRKAQKSKMKEELMPITWHPTRMQDGAFQKTKRKGLRYLIKVLDSCFWTI